MRPLTYLALALPMVCSCRDTERLIAADPLVQVEPSTIDFGVISIHDHATRTVKITNLGRAPLTLNGLSVECFRPAWASTEAEAQNPFSSDGVAIPAVLTTGQSVDVTVTYDPAGQGPVGGAINLSTDDADQPESSIPIEAVALDAQVQVQEDNLDFGAIEVGSSLTQPLHLVNPYPLAVTVTPGDAGLDGLDQFSFAPVQVQPESSGDLSVTFQPNAIGKVATALSITPCEGCASQLVNLFGEGLDSPLAVDPGPINFGSVDGPSATQNVRITNISTLPVELHGVGLDPSSDPQFSVTLPIPEEVLIPGAWLSTTLQYSVSRAGPAQGTFQVQSSSHRHPTLEIPVEGASEAGSE